MIGLGGGGRWHPEDVKRVILSPYLINNICKVENIVQVGGDSERKKKKDSAMFESAMNGQHCRKFEEVLIIILNILII